MGRPSQSQTAEIVRRLGEIDDEFVYLAINALLSNSPEDRPSINDLQRRLFDKDYYDNNDISMNLLSGASKVEESMRSNLTRLSGFKDRNRQIMS